VGEESLVLLDPNNTTGVIATLGFGVLAGVLIGTGLAGYAARGLPEISWTLQFQLEDRLFAKAMPPLMLGSLLALVTASLLSRGGPRLMLGAATVCMLLVLVITIGFEVPLNKQIQSWTAGSAPVDWTRIRDLWLQRHLLRTISGTASFVSALLAVVL
jgi:uncharacterized membrane protein